MPKQKINSGVPEYTTPAGTTSRTPVKLNTNSTPRWYVVLMLGLMIVGLAWLVVNYLAGPSIPFMDALGAWNYLIGFALMIVGLLMTMGWK